jgi:hypothetical protein
MSETAKHETLDKDPSAGIVDRLDSLDLATLSFVQLKRLQHALQRASTDVDKESVRRSEEDDDGDTVQVAAPRI